MAGASEPELLVSNEESSKIDDGAVRMSKLRSALDKTVKACVSTLSYDLLKAHFNPKSRDEKKCLQNTCLQFKEKALALVKDEVVLMMREENVEQLLLKLDELCKLSSSHSGEVLWRPTGVPVDDVTVQLLPGILVLREKLKVLLSDDEAETDRMKRAILERRRLIHSLKTEIAKNDILLYGCLHEDAKEINAISQDN